MFHRCSHTLEMWSGEIGESRISNGEGTGQAAPLGSGGVPFSHGGDVNSYDGTYQRGPKLQRWRSNTCILFRGKAFHRARPTSLWLLSYACLSLWTISHVRDMVLALTLWRCMKINCLEMFRPQPPWLPGRLTSAHNLALLNTQLISSEKCKPQVRRAWGSIAPCPRERRVLKIKGVMTYEGSSEVQNWPPEDLKQSFKSNKRDR